MPLVRIQKIDFELYFVNLGPQLQRSRFRLHNIDQLFLDSLQPFLHFFHNRVNPLDLCLLKSHPNLVFVPPNAFSHLVTAVENALQNNRIAGLLHQ